MSLTTVSQVSQLWSVHIFTLYIESCDLMLCVSIRVTTYMYKFLAVQHATTNALHTLDS